MKLYIFNKEFETEDHIEKSPTYVVADTMEEAVLTYKASPTNNESIWSVTALGENVFVAGVKGDIIPDPDPQVLLGLLDSHYRSERGAWCYMCGHAWPCPDNQAAALIRRLFEEQGDDVGGHMT